jgi:hypothetical protein
LRAQVDETGAGSVTIGLVALRVNLRQFNDAEGLAANPFLSYHGRHGRPEDIALFFRDCWEKQRVKTAASSR